MFSHIFYSTPGAAFGAPGGGNICSKQFENRPLVLKYLENTPHQCFSESAQSTYSKNHHLIRDASYLVIKAFEVTTGGGHPHRACI